MTVIHETAVVDLKNITIDSIKALLFNSIKLEILKMNNHLHFTDLKAKLANTPLN